MFIYVSFFYIWVIVIIQVINTDDIIPANRGTNDDPDHLKQYALEHIIGAGELLQYDEIVAGENFGCGSSREHAPWALLDYGFRVIIAPSFADIFFNNCFKNGILPIVLDAAIVDQLFQEIEQPGFRLTINLPEQTIVTPAGEEITFDVDAFRKHCLLNGLDDIGLTLQHRGDIEAYEQRRKQEAPWLFGNQG